MREETPEVTVSSPGVGTIRFDSIIDFTEKLDALNDPARKKLAEVRERDCSDKGDTITEKVAQLAVTCAWVRHKLLTDVLDDELEQHGLETLTSFDLMLEDLASELSAAMRAARRSVRDGLRGELRELSEEA